MVDNWLPARTRVWIEKRWEAPVSVELHAITYDAPWGGMRISKQSTGYAVHERGEKSGYFDTFVIWVDDMDALQRHLAWEHKSDWEAGGVYRLPYTASLADGFTSREDSNRKVYLSRKGKEVARMPAGAYGERADEHSHLLGISLDDLEYAIQDPRGVNAAGAQILTVAFPTSPRVEPPAVATPAKKRSLWPWRRRDA
ncbi:hypothetical protein GCM10025867_49980 (plasmid) [Frondihabitans sucicola]|uniref:Uncharacterized protein n=1 Tax=Frondihabitans sucicola TaxID=1268041 RepID=A0ABN6Y9G8_9MICO|nr:hypothetical protein [Frondihabitans sucicola]BDZ52757.1 hypothetical protein GCM10025867_49980 [Frondihabitans sucicola]